MFWNKYPFARILLPFLSGISIALIFNLSFLLPIFFFITITAFLVVIVVFYQKKLSYRLRWITGALIILFYFLAGYQLATLKNSRNNISFFGARISDENYVLAKLDEPVQVKEKICKCIVNIIAVKDSQNWYNTSGKAILYFEKDSLSPALKYGDEVLFRSRLLEVSSPMNPGEYNYKNYLKYHTIEYSAYIDKYSWKTVRSGQGNILKSIAFNLRNRLLQVLKHNKLEGDEYAVVSALLVGFTDNLDPELIRVYQGTGAVHILSVSGLHVGIIFIVLNFLLQFFDKFRWGRLPKAFLLLGFIWFYAVLTGMSPSVMRASAMISFIVIGNAFRQPPNIYNTIAASAFVLLMFNPYMITDVGFQLSYLAVLGIVSIYPVINKAFTSKYWISRQLWSLIAVSLSAQLITFPLCLFYFHQFPNYFLLTNIIAVPLSGLVIYLGIAVLLLSFIPWLSMILAKALSFSLMLLNGSIAYIEGLPYSVTKSISVSFFDLFLLYGIIICCCIFIQQRKNNFFLAAVSLLFLLIVSFTMRNIRTSCQKEIIVYHIKKHTAVDFIDGHTAAFICDSGLYKDKQKQGFHIMNSRCKHRISKLISLVISDSGRFSSNDFIYHKGNFWGFGGKKLAVVDKATYNTQRLDIDYLLVTRNPDLSIAELLKQYNPARILFDGSNSEKNIKKWSVQCTESGVPFYSTASEGAWVCELNQ